MVASIVIMFLIQWAYALANIGVFIIIYLYIGIMNPGVFPGIAEYSTIDSIKEAIQNCCRYN